jgi:hypothetical protein
MEANRLLVSVFDLLVFETLNIKAIHQLWGRKVGDLGFGTLALSAFAFIQGEEATEDGVGFGISQIDQAQIPERRPHSEALNMVVAGRDLKTDNFRIKVPSEPRWVRLVSDVNAILSSALQGQGRPTSR